MVEAETPRKGDWIQCYPSGKPFWPLDPREEDVDIEDVAHALSNMCRWNGHCQFFYSVAEHSIRVSELVGTLQALLHDAPEAYLADVPRPVKPYLVGYYDFENELWRVIAKKFGVATVLSPSVKAADVALLHAERRDLLNPSLRPWESGQLGEYTPLEYTRRINPMQPEIARRKFLSRFEELKK